MVPGMGKSFTRALLIQISVLRIRSELNVALVIDENAAHGIHCEQERLWFLENGPAHPLAENARRVRQPHTIVVSAISAAETITFIVVRIRVEFPFLERMND
jgi:hypothetical protein